MTIPASHRRIWTTLFPDEPPAAKDDRSTTPDDSATPEDSSAMPDDSSETEPPATEDLRRMMRPRKECRRAAAAAAVGPRSISRRPHQDALASQFTTCTYRSVGRAGQRQRWACCPSRTRRDAIALARGCTDHVARAIGFESAPCSTRSLLPTSATQPQSLAETDMVSAADWSAASLCGRCGLIAGQPAARRSVT